MEHEQDRQEQRECEVHLRLFVAGSTIRSMRAIVNVKRTCEESLTVPYVLEVVDIYQQPTLAKSDQIVATPTLVRIRPAPVRQFIGDMTDLSSLFAGLNLGGNEGGTP